VLAAIGIPSALAVRMHYSSVYNKSQIAYERYQKRMALQRQAEAEAQSNEGKIARLRAAVAARPHDVQARWALADELQKFRMLEDALEQLRAIVKLQPDSQLAAVAIANSLLATRDLKGAEREYRVITQKWPKNIEGWQGLAATLYQMRRYRDAGIAGRRALSMDPKDQSSQIIVASSALEFALENPDDHETRDPLQIAHALYSMLLKGEPDNAQYHYQLGLAKYLLRDKKGALPHLEKAVALTPDRPNIAFDYAQILISSGKYVDARKFLDAAVARMPKVAGLHFLIAESYQYDSDPRAVKEAIRSAEKAVQLSPNTATYWDRLGSEYLKALDIEGARKAFEKSLLLDANRSYPYQQLAGIYTRLGDAKRASIAAKMATRMVANDETMRHLEALSAQYPGAANLLMIRADRYRDLKQYGPARDLYEQVLTLDPSSAAAKRGIEAIDKVYGQRSRVQ